MATHLAEADLVDPGMVHGATGRPQPADDNDLTEDDERSTAARGIVTAALISAPFWALFAFALYLLL
jgi:hypothetical protein